MNNFIAPLLLIGVMIIACHAAFASQRRSRDQIERWANHRKLDLIHVERRRFRQGPFWFSNSRRRFVYRVSAYDRRGRLLTGWLRAGRGWLGLSGDEVDERWD